MPTVDEILASSPLARLRRVSRSGGDRQVTVVQLAERFAELDHAPHTSLVVLSRSASAEVTDYRLDMALRWASIHQVAAVAAFAAERWRPTVTVTDIAGRADIALISIPMDTDLTELVQAIMREIGGGAERALGRAQQGLDAVLRAERDGADLDKLCASVSQALGTTVEFRPLAPGDVGPSALGGPSANGEAATRRPRRPAGMAARRAAGRRMKSAHRSWSGRRRSATSPLRMRSAIPASAPGSSCTPRPSRPHTCSTWHDGRVSCRSAPGASCWPSC